jgi:spore maturation protein CgeB
MINLIFSIGGGPKMIRGLNFAFFGPSLVSSSRNSSAGYFRGILRALHDKGHQITFYEPAIPGQQSPRDIVDPSWVKIITYPTDDERNLYPLYTDAHHADVIVKISHIGVFDAVMEKEIVDMKRLGNIVLFWDIDPFNTLNRICLKPADPFIALIPKFDAILTLGGGEPILKTYREFHAQRCISIYNALDFHVHFPVRANPKFIADLAVFSNRHSSRMSQVADLFFNAAIDLPDKKFLLAGTGWQGKLLTRNVHYVGPIFPRDHNAFYSSPKCVLHASLPQERLAPFPAAAVFQAIGAGACLITDHWTGLENFLAPDSEILLARTHEELVDKIRTTTVKRAGEINTAARNHLLAEHTCVHRAEQIEKYLGLSGLVPRYAMT